jgi:cyclophilin family peptidyl-prolyl cis-trans isomerase
MKRTLSTFHRRLAGRRASSTSRLAAAILVATTLAACGGGGDGKPTATVAATSVSVKQYAQPALLTINGTNLDNISVTSPGCKNITRLTAAPTASTSTTAYYGCTVSGAYTSQFSIQSNGKGVATSNSFTVAQPQVTLTVNNGLGAVGTIVIALAGDKMPITVDNFLWYVNTNTFNNQNYYSGQIFDRVVPGFVVQGGMYGPSSAQGVLPTAKGPTQPPIPLEIDPTLLNVTGSIAMARSSAPASATAEFYINLANNTKLDGSYAVFGNVVSGMDVVQAIVAAPAQCQNDPLAGTYDCLPIPNVMIVSAVQSS